VPVESKLPVAISPGIGGIGVTVSLAVCDISGLKLHHCDQSMGSWSFNEICQHGPETLGDFWCLPTLVSAVTERLLKLQQAQTCLWIWSLGVLLVVVRPGIVLGWS
jgi:hypothetical protein